jgi:hypothetical protein
MYLNSFFIPKEEISSVDELSIKAIISSNFTADRSWDIHHINDSIDSIVIEDYPIFDSNTTNITKHEKILFLRLFEGKDNQKNYVEISQKILHLEGLHYVPEISSFCKFDDLSQGERVPYITVHYDTERKKVTAVTAKRELLDRFMVITGMILIRLFDISRTPETFHSYDGQNDKILVRDKDKKIFGDGSAFDASYSSYFRGFQLIDNKEPRERILESIVNKIDGYNMNNLWHMIGKTVYTMKCHVIHLS